MKYYALWYYSYCDGARVAFGISEHPETLVQLHKNNIKNPESKWFHYDERVNEMKIEPIECYTYHSETEKIEPYDGRQKKTVMIFMLSIHYAMIVLEAHFTMIL